MFGYTSLGFGSGGVATAVTSVSAPSAPFFSDALGNGSVNATRGTWVDLFQHPYALHPPTMTMIFSLDNKWL